MSDVKRYKTTDEMLESGSFSFGDSYAEFVLAYDYDALAADNARLTGELAEAKRELERMDGMHRAFDAKYIAWLGERDALAAQVKGLREALTDIAGRPDTTDAHWIIDIARAALAGPTRTADQPSVQGTGK